MSNAVLEKQEIEDFKSWEKMSAAEKQIISAIANAFRVRDTIVATSEQEKND